jgi:hypothetical protein
MRINRSLIGDILPAGSPIYGPSDELFARPIEISAIESAIAGSASDDEPLDARELGNIRVSMLTELARLPMSDAPLADEKIEAIVTFALLAYQTAGHLAGRSPRPTILWNEELDPAQLLARTLLLADHVLVPDRLFDKALHNPSNRSIGDLARAELSNEALLRSGHVIPVPNGVAMAVGSSAAIAQTQRDLEDPRVVEFVRDQLILEGPTAREVLIVNARDDLARSPRFWLYGRIDTDIQEDRSFGTRMLQPYDPGQDYRPWIDRVKRDAVSYYIQRTVGRLTTADLLGAEYVAASPFEARLLEKRSQRTSASPESASIWANVPSFANLRSPDLARLLRNDDAVEDLRGRVRAAVANTIILPDTANAIAQLTAEIDQASSTLERRMRTDRAYSALLPSLAGGAGLVVGAAGGVPGVAGAAIGALSGLLPYLGSRLNARREASYLFVMARRHQRRRP